MFNIPELIDIGKTTGIGIVLFGIVYFLGLQLQSYSLEQGVSQAFSDFYSGLIPLAIMSIIGLSIFRVRYLEIFDDFMSNKVKFALISGWIIFIVLLSFSGTQVVPVPRASVEALQLTAGTEIYLSSVIPGILEDLVYLVGLPMVLLVTIALISEFVLGLEISLGTLTVMALIAAFIASVGYNVFVIPGFAAAHVPSYGATNPALFWAFLFGFGQSTIYIFTGMFFPLAHVLHNAIIVIGAQSGLSVGPLAITGGGL